jgi:hypothetical protein
MEESSETKFVIFDDFEKVKLGLGNFKVAKKIIKV